MSERHHYIETKIYDDDGDLIKMVSSHVPGDYEYTEADNRYLDWLDRNRAKRTIIEERDNESI